MARTDWDAIARRYQHDYMLSGISIKKWCKQHDINYASARRYLKSDAQLPSESQTFYIATPNEVESASNEPGNEAKTDRKRNAQKSAQKSAQRAECADSAQQSAQIDAKGRFVKGNTMSVGAPGNPNPQNQMKPGNQAGRKHGGYSKFFPAGKFDEARELKLKDELVLVRTQVISIAESLQQINVDLKATSDPELKSNLYRDMIKLQELLDSRIARIESLTRTLSNLQLDRLNEPRLIAETERLKMATKKGSVETRILERDSGGDTTQIDDILGDIQDMDSDGMMSDNSGSDNSTDGFSLPDDDV